MGRFLPSRAHDGSVFFTHKGTAPKAADEPGIQAPICECENNGYCAEKKPRPVMLFVGMAMLESCNGVFFG